MRLTDERLAHLRRDAPTWSANGLLANEEVNALIDEVVESRERRARDLEELATRRGEVDALRRAVASEMGEYGASVDELIEKLEASTRARPAPSVVQVQTQLVLREVTAERDAAQALLYRVRALLAVDGAGS